MTTTGQFLFAPLLFQFFLAVLLLFLWRRTDLQRWASIFGNLIGLGLASMLFLRVWRGGALSVQAGGWEAPFGITLVADMFSATLVLLTSAIGLAVAIYSAASVQELRLRLGYFPILQFLLMGLAGAFLAGDIFNLYVWFEIIIISSFVLITIGGERLQLEGAVKYFTINVLASVIFLTAIAILYGLAGTLNLADLAVKAKDINNQALFNVSALMFFAGFGIKSAVFPLYFWLPASYHAPPAAVSAVFAGLLTKVGVYALMRIFSLVFTADPFIYEFMGWIAILTLFTGGVGALVQNNIRRVFSFFIVCHIGFMIAGLAIFSRPALAGAVFYMAHDIVVKANLFLLAGLIFKIRHTNSIKKLGGLYAEYPRLSLLLAVPLFSLVGIPPLSGFWPKVSLVLAGLEGRHYLLVGAMLLASFLTLIIIARLWAEVFWKNGQAPEIKPNAGYFPAMEPKRRALLVAPIAMLALASLYIGFAAEHLQLLSDRIASELSDPASYIRAVLP